ncbi:MAG: flagellar basal body-associated FliL family protein [Paracoccaceae bacterium]
MRFLVPVILALVGAGTGIGAGLHFATDPLPAKKTETEACEPGDPAGAAPEIPQADLEYVKLSNQFIVPLLTDQEVRAMAVVSLSIEVVPGGTDAVYAREPKLRDLFLQVLFDQANMGGFDGAFTRAEMLDTLRLALRESAQTVLPDTVTDVLITEIARQEV